MESKEAFFVFSVGKSGQPLDVKEDEGWIEDEEGWRMEDGGWRTLAGPFIKDFIFLPLWRPGVDVARDEKTTIEESLITYNPYAGLSIYEQRQRLPIFRCSKWLF